MCNNLSFSTANTITVQFSKIQFNCSVMSNSLWPHGLQHARLPCPSPICEVCLNPCQLSWWCHPTISSSVIPLSSCPQSFSTSGSFPKSQFFTSGGQSTGASASASVLPMNTQDWYTLGGLVWSPYSPYRRLEAQHLDHWQQACPPRLPACPGWWHLAALLLKGLPLPLEDSWKLLQIQSIQVVWDFSCDSGQQSCFWVALLKRNLEPQRSV